MTDIATRDFQVSTPARYSVWPRLRLPKFSLGAKVALIPAALGYAFGMAYVAPYGGADRQPATTSDVDLQGRDPRW